MGRAPLILNSAALSALILEGMIGDTILANLILIGLAAMLLLPAVLIGLINLIQQRSVGAFFTFAFSGALIAYIFARFHSDSVPAGFGP